MATGQSSLSATRQPNERPHRAEVVETTYSGVKALGALGADQRGRQPEELAAELVPLRVEVRRGNARVDCGLDAPGVAPVPPCFFDDAPIIGGPFSTSVGFGDSFWFDNDDTLGLLAVFNTGEVDEVEAAILGQGIALRSGEIESGETVETVLAVNRTTSGIK